MGFVKDLISKIEKKCDEKLNVPYKKTVYGIGKSNDVIMLAERYGCTCELLPSLSEISWLDILLRKIYFVRMPPKRLTISFADRWKRRIIRWNRLSLSSDIYVCLLHDAVWLNHGDKTLFTVGAHIAQIYSEHLSDFEVVLVENGGDEVIGREIYSLAEKLQEESTDPDEGITVFANVTSLWFIRCYRLLHPNRKIVLRFHDLIDSGLEMTREQVFRFVDAVRKEGIVDDVESYDFADAKALKCKYRPNGANPEFMSLIDVPYRERLYSFTGTSGHGKAKDERLRDLNVVSNAIKTLYPKISDWCVEKNCSHDDWLPYVKFAKNSASAEIYVDLFREKPEEGFSFRIPEALWLNRKIISNRKCLQKEPFYSPERIFLIGVDSVERLRSFLEMDVEPLSREVIRFYDTRLWWTEDDPVQEVCE